MYISLIQYTWNTQMTDTSEPETVAPCPWPCCKSLVLLGLKVMTSQSSSLTVSSQFPASKWKHIPYPQSLPMVASEDCHSDPSE